jgi:hypothetical protein
MSLGSPDLFRLAWLELLRRLRILLSAPIAVWSTASSVRRYFCMVTMLECPSRSRTTSRSAPPASSQEARAARSLRIVTDAGKACGIYR